MTTTTTPPPIIDGPICVECDGDLTDAQRITFRIECEDGYDTDYCLQCPHCGAYN